MKQLVIGFSLSFLAVLSSNAATVNFNGIVGGGSYNLSVTSYIGRRFTTVYKQQFDFSCGSAALASLLAFHYDDKVNEQHVFMDMYEHGNQAKIQKLGFSMLDMKRYLERRGYNSDGFKINLDQLIIANVPAITIINNNGYMHFVIIKGVSDHEVLIGDPAVGVKVIPREKFLTMWKNHILFSIYDDQAVAASHFQDEKEWKLRVKAPLGEAIDRSSLAQFNMLKPGNIDF